jgi:uncharacterized protein
MQFIRANTLKSRPWKNGGGETTEIAVWPVGASLDTFDWRISMATVEQDGPFSVFPGIDRTLALLKGGLKLQFADRPNAVLTPGSTPFSFPGELAVTAELWGGPAHDLNVMTRRGKWRCTVEGQRQSFRVAAMPGFAKSPTCAVILVDGSATVHSAVTRSSLGRLDTVLVDPTTEHIDVSLSPDGFAYLVMLEAV